MELDPVVNLLNRIKTNIDEYVARGIHFPEPLRQVGDYQPLIDDLGGTMLTRKQCMTLGWQKAKVLKRPYVFALNETYMGSMFICLTLPYTKAMAPLTAMLLLTAKEHKSLFVQTTEQIIYVRDVKARVWAFAFRDQKMWESWLARVTSSPELHSLLAPDLYR